MATYTVSDLHGQYDVFIKGLKRIGFKSDDMLYVVGDAIDRGPDGLKILTYIMEHKNTELILGNHEFMMLNSVDKDGKAKCSGRDAELWLYYNGGMATYSKYIDMPDKKRVKLLEWLASRKYIITVEAEREKYCLTHSYYIPQYEEKTFSELSYADAWQIVWKSLFRSEPATHAEDVYSDYEDRIFITGHVPVQRAFGVGAGEAEEKGIDYIKSGNVVDIDGGCAGGKMELGDNGAIFLRLDDKKIFTSLFK